MASRGGPRRRRAHPGGRRRWRRRSRRGNGRTARETDDATIRANFVGIAPKVNGHIVELPIHDNQQVTQGELLFVDRPAALRDRPRAGARRARPHAEGSRWPRQGDLDGRRRRDAGRGAARRLGGRRHAPRDRSRRRRCRDRPARGAAGGVGGRAASRGGGAEARRGPPEARGTAPLGGLRDRGQSRGAPDPSRERCHGQGAGADLRRRGERGPGRGARAQAGDPGDPGCDEGPACRVRWPRSHRRRPSAGAPRTTSGRSAT